MSTLRDIGEIILNNLTRVWPLLVISIPFAVLLRASGAGEKLKGAFGKRPVLSILIATAAGAFSPLCSCTVIPVVASMLLAGIPLPAVMAFWIASPTMDPEVFFMGAAFLGWDLAVARLVTTLLVSLGGGLLTLWVQRRGWIGDDFIRVGASSSRQSIGVWASVRRLAQRFRHATTPEAEAAAAPADGGCGCSRSTPLEPAPCACSQSARSEPAPCGCGSSGSAPASRLRGILTETVRVTLWIAQLMLLAFTLEALILKFVPQEAIIGWIGTGNPISPLLAALIGIPVYTGNLMAIPLMGGLLEQGMSPGGVLAFLIAGPVTTIPAMAAVWGVVKQRVFWLYIAIGLIGAIGFGYLYTAVDAIRGG
jgi:uncharacterized membrane protein YraQ (UPF0718 family)